MIYTSWIHFMLTFNYLCQCFIAGLIGGLLVSSSTQAEPPAGTNWTPFEAMTDEFNGKALDTTKWHGHNPRWRGRPPVFFHNDCVEVHDGKLLVSAFTAENSAQQKLPNGFTHISGFVKSRQTARFGYFEVRAKLMNSTLVSCFWLARPSREEWSEIDVVEVAAGVEKHANKLHPNTHYFHGPHYRGTRDKHLVDPSTHELPFQLADDFHTYGLEWTPTHIRWYVDNKLIRESVNKRHYQPLNMNINVEANEYFGALPDDARLPAVYEVDWVRTWRPVE